MVKKMKCGVVTLLLLTIVAVMVSGCPFGSTPLDEISDHLMSATDALEELNLVEGKTNPFTLDDQIYIIDQIFLEMEVISEEDVKEIARYNAYYTWTEALRSASQIVKDDYQSYRGHTTKADQYYTTFNYVGLKQELNLAEAKLNEMSGKAFSAASSLDQVTESDISSKELAELHRTKTAIMNLYHQCTELKNNLKEKAQIR
ncbi:MAG: hypothetical protein Q7J09_10555 [Methanocalculus sp.]|nr:hypothetical protein [Methanocalculus sp.]